MAIVGEPGIGKSRLAAELAAIAGRPRPVLTGRCPRLRRGHHVLAAARDRPAGDGRSLRSTSSAATLGRGAVGGAPGRGRRRARGGQGRRGHRLGVPAADRRTRPAAAARARDRRRAPGRAGARWSCSLDVAARLRDAPVLIVWVARPDLLDERSGLGEPHRRRGRARARSALGCGQRGAARGDRRRPPGPGRAATDRRGGRRQPAVPRAARRLRRRAAAAPADTLPPALHALLAARLDRLDAASARRSRSVRSWATRSRRAIGARAGRRHHPRRARAGLRAPREARPARPRATARASLRFRHGLVREVAYASLAKSARARLHERHAAWLEGSAPSCRRPTRGSASTSRPPAATSRRSRGGAPAELASAGGPAARRGGARGARPRRPAGRDRLPRPRRRAARRRAGAGRRAAAGAGVGALRDGRHPSRAEGLADRAVATSAALGPPRRRERGRRSSASASGSTCHPESFDVPAAMAVVERGLGDAPRRGRRRSGVARAAYLMADLAWLMGDLVGSYAHAERMLVHARRAGSGFDIATALVFMALGARRGAVAGAGGDRALRRAGG